MAGLAGKTLFITGASRGIGLAIALRAARDGANVAIAAKTAEPHPKLPGTIFTAARKSSKPAARPWPLPVDVRDEAQVAEALARDRAKIRRRRHRRQQRQRHCAWRQPADRHEAFRPDASDQRARLLHDRQARLPLSGEVRQSACADAGAAARHEGKMVRGAYRLFHGEIRHEPRRAGPCRRISRRRESRSTRCGRAPPSPPPRSTICSAASN